MNKLFTSPNVVLGLGRLLRSEPRFPPARYNHWHLQLVASGFVPEARLQLGSVGVCLEARGVWMQVTWIFGDKKQISAA